ncbi:DUF6622 family protein [Chromobacterium sp. IIBBL 290-4]|uniref:DUF6622 family protein n=1 Tax=Chromobacterium sp. IIBBL 290-4 TaxID=2953890 RepID=UPI0020B6BE5F|nr:DUF6622 family protein [Chromobacterium sp. IIBBL 290-4]UTH72617.1 hypothetical protein NKT35_13820 [Chromobacterium sp. IIBBL 290-4]
MLLGIVRHTPWPVFVLFFVLLSLGRKQMETRQLSRGRLLLLPLAMLGLSAYGVLTEFGPAVLPVAGWLVGLALALAIAGPWIVPAGVRYLSESRSYEVPGSGLPLILMMAIFFTHYAVAVAMAMRLPLTSGSVFPGLIGLAYGVLSGLVAARAQAIFRGAARADGAPASV